MREAGIVGERTGPDAGGGYLDRDGGPLLRAIELHGRLDAVVRAVREPHTVIADQDGRRLDECDIPRDAAVVPPVGVDGRYGVRVARIVDLEDERIAGGSELARHFEI